MEKAYEITFIVKSSLENEAIDKLIENVKQKITETGGRVENIDILGKKTLAYEIKGEKEGIYVSIRLFISSALIGEINYYLKVNENILRHLVVQI